jgi:hypothetical protein
MSALDKKCPCGEPEAMCPHLGAFATYAEKYEWYAARVPELREALGKLADVARQAGALQDRLRIAQAAHDAGEIAEDFGAELPYQDELRNVADAVATFGPMAKNIPAAKKSPALMVALEVFVEAAKLIVRALTGK